VDRLDVGFVEQAVERIEDMAGKLFDRPAGPARPLQYNQQKQEHHHPR